MDVPDEAATVLDGRYEVGPLVGIGGTAQVHRAWDRDRGCPVAVKVFRPGAAPTPGYGGARELQVLTGVRHPGLVGVHGAGVDPQGRPFVVMDFVDGHSLSARLDDGPLPAAAVARLGAVLAAALDVVHARGVVHRDVKPANVLLDTDGHPWLTDFGIARIVDATRVTATGIVVGTAAYMAPEQVRGEAVGPAADVYALGLVLLEAVTGRREYEGGAVESALARLHRAPHVPAGMPDPLAATVRAMTAAAPADRPTARAVAAVLGPAVSGGPAVAPRRPAGRRLAVPVAALAALVAAASAGAMTLVGPSGGVRVPAAVRAAAPAPAPAAPRQVPLAPDLAGAANAAVAAMGAPQPVDPAQPVPVVLTTRDTAAADPPSAGDGPDDHHAAPRAAQGDDRADPTADRHGRSDGANADKTSARPKNDAADEADKAAYKPEKAEKGDAGGGKGDSGKSGKGTSGSSGGSGKGGGHSGSNSGKD